MSDCSSRRRELRVLDVEAGVALFAAAVAVEDREAHLQSGVQSQLAAHPRRAAAVAVVCVAVAGREVQVGVIARADALQLQLGDRVVAVGHQQLGVRRAGLGHEDIPLQGVVDGDDRDDADVRDLFQNRMHGWTLFSV